ncbi:hydrogenase-4 component E [Desulfonispora thiosulfatigenes DSM 11270]|uniref:Hydrogenase-4 component E n=1 Tax=Desulfonispora thiosulfatigenes DSM 11270 TaxID=656914 RepID=A0A1W1VCV4_DESTI|nr:hypothetical protein [Desulfonispora thiosulfatigenes]SMB90784.1 hydrogenase-4 component E [Desulfonispora thiosulfatigenes DSM 11270]
MVETPQLEILIAIILTSAIFMSGFRRIKLLTQTFALQSLAISCISIYLGYTTGESHFYTLAIFGIITKVIFIPYIIRTSIRNLKHNRELGPLITPFNSYFLASFAVVMTYYFLQDAHNYLLTTGGVIMIIGAFLIITRKKAITQMIGFLTMENGIVLIETSIAHISLIIESVIILEGLLLALIMGIMIFHINKTFQTINTDHFSNPEE